MKVHGADKVIEELQGFQNKIPKAVQSAIAKLTTIGYDTARNTLKNTDHAQKYGDELVNEIGQDITPNSGRIFAPITKTPEMYQQVQYAEFGAGVTATKSNEYFIAPDMSIEHPKADGSWFYKTTDADKSPTMESGQKVSDVGYPRKAKSSKGYLLGRTDRSQPAKFMYTARKKIELEIATTFKGEFET